MDGIALGKKIRFDDSLGQPAVISMTGIAEEEAQPKMMQAGANAFFSKPLNFEALIAKIRELLETRKSPGMEEKA